MNARDMLAFKIGLQAGIDQGRRVGFMNGHRAGTNSLYEAAVAMGHGALFKQILDQALVLESTRLASEIAPTPARGKA